MCTIGLISPPTGMTVFVIQAQHPEIPVARIYLGTLPFLVADFVLVGLLIVMPGVGALAAARSLLIDHVPWRYRFAKPRGRNAMKFRIATVATLAATLSLATAAQAQPPKQERRPRSCVGALVGFARRLLQGHRPVPPDQQGRVRVRPQRRVEEQREGGDRGGEPRFQPRLSRQLGALRGRAECVEIPHHHVREHEDREDRRQHRHDDRQSHDAWRDSSRHHGRDLQQGRQASLRQLFDRRLHRPGQAQAHRLRHEGFHSLDRRRDRIRDPARSQASERSRAEAAARRCHSGIHPTGLASLPRPSTG